MMMIRKEQELEKHEPSKGRIRKGGVSGSKEQRSKITDLIRNFNALTSTKGEGGEQMARNRNTEDRILKKDTRDQSMKRKASDVVAAMVLEEGSVGKSKRPQTSAAVRTSESEKENSKILFGPKTFWT